MSDANHTEEPPIRPYKILVAVAMDETADWALVEGIRITRDRTDAELHVVCALEEGLGDSPDDAMEQVGDELDRAQSHLEQRIERLWQEMGGRKVIAHIRPGPACPVILQTAIDIGADLVVVGTHRRRGLEKLVLGSVAEHVIRDARCAVLVAMPRDYSHQTASARFEPPCPDCLAVRRSTDAQQYWCDRHSRKYQPPHIYRPRRDGRASVMPTY